MNEQLNNEPATIAETGSDAHGGVLGSLGIEGGRFAAQFINFLLVFLVVWFLILKPLTKKMEERRKIIDESLDRAKEIESKLVMANQSYQEKLDEAKAEANKIVARAHEEAKALGERMKQDAKTEIAGLVGQAREKIQAEKEATILEIRTETAGIAVAIAEKIIGERLDLKKDSALAADMLKRLHK